MSSSRGVIYRGSLRLMLSAVRNKVPIIQVVRNCIFLGLILALLIPPAEADLSLLKTISTVSGLAGVNVSGGFVYVAGFVSNQLLVYNAVDQTLAHTVDLPGTGPRGVAVSGGNVYVTLQGANQLLVYNAASLTLTQTVNLPPGTGPTGVAVSGGNVYVTGLNSDELLVYNAASLTLTQTVNLPNQPHSYGVAVGGGYIYVTGISSNQLLVYNAASLTLTQTVNLPPGTDPEGVAVSCGYVYIVGYSSGDLLVYKASDLTLVDTVLIEAALRGVAVSDGDVFVTGSSSGNNFWHYEGAYFTPTSQAPGFKDPAFATFPQTASAFNANYTAFNPASSFAWANGTATVDPFGIKGNFTSSGAIASTSAINRHTGAFVNATEASFSMSATTTADEFRIKTPTTGSLLLDSGNTANNAAFSMTQGSSYAQGVFRAIDFSAGYSNTQVIGNGAQSVANAFSTSNADWTK